eukprot:SAG31_NODE_827_length_11749_cov_14.363090_11_plen_172_part_00
MVLHSNIIALLTLAYNLCRCSIIQADGSLWLAMLSNVKIIALLILDRLIFQTILGWNAYLGISIVFVAFVLHSIVERTYPISTACTSASKPDPNELSRNSTEVSRSSIPSSASRTGAFGRDNARLARSHGVVHRTITVENRTDDLSGYDWSAAIMLFSYVGAMVTVAGYFP